MESYESGAARHDIVFDSPGTPYNQGNGPNLIDGPLLGNGDLGAVVHGPPERLLVNVGKNDVWDRRILPLTESPVTQQEYIDTVMKDEDGCGLRMLDERSKELHRPYDQVFPCPKPCGQIIIEQSTLTGAEMEQRLSLSTAVVDSTFEKEGAKTFHSTFVPYQRNLVLTRLTFDTVAVPRITVSLHRRHDAADATMTKPEFGGAGPFFWVRHVFPSDAMYPDGFEYVMMGTIRGGSYGVRMEANAVRAEVTDAASGSLELYVSVATSRDAADPLVEAEKLLNEAVAEGFDAIESAHRTAWREYWECSAIRLSDEFMEKLWYLNRYFIACCSKKGCVAPGLYGNWITNDASYWHGDYHYNYNFQQPFWGVYSCNTPDLAWPYYEFTKAILPMAQTEARTIYGMRGAKYPLTAYPTRMEWNPYPVIPWDRNMCLSAWAAQNFWWHYLYTQDDSFLEEWAYPVIVECARFYRDFMREENGRFVIWPTVSPEHHGTTEKFRLNRNCTIDLALIKFILQAAVDAGRRLGLDEEERVVWETMIERIADYPTIDTPDGTIFVDVENAEPIEYNLPVPISPVVPGDDIGLGSQKELYEIACRTAEHISINGNDGFIILPMAWMRLGMKHKYTEFRQMCSDRIWRNGVTTTSNNRSEIYTKALFPFAGPVVENFAITAVINEMLMQSYDGVIRLFPALPDNLDAGIDNLLAVGSFLVSSEIEKGTIREVSITSGVGNICRVYNPWPDHEVHVVDTALDAEVESAVDAGVLSFPTIKGHQYSIEMNS